jgi:hypothetical protein
MGKCAICGKPSGMYPLCLEHSKMIKTGGVVKNSKGEWVLATKKEETKASTKCVVCGKESKGMPLCHDCWKDAMAKEEEIDKNSQTPASLKTYYYNLKSSIYRMTGIEFIKPNALKLFSIAFLLSDSYSDTSLATRVADDVKDIMDAKKEKKVIRNDETVKQDLQQSGQMRTEDGHMVKSLGEQAVDNALYNSGWAHCYEKKVVGIDERAVFCDFFIPGSFGKGVYIEYWGMETDDYNDNKAEKRDLYKKHNLPLIEVEKDDYKQTGVLSENLNTEIRRLNKEYKLGINVPGGE